MKQIILPAILAVALAVPAAAQTFRAENRVKVSGTATSILVQSGGGFGARGMWCAAADFARDVLAASGTQRIYVAEPRTRADRSPVRFTLDPSGLSPVPITFVGASLRKAGGNLSVDHAYSFCADAKLVNR